MLMFCAVKKYWKFWFENRERPHPTNATQRQGGGGEWTPLVPPSSARKGYCFQLFITSLHISWFPLSLILDETSQVSSAAKLSSLKCFQPAGTFTGPRRERSQQQVHGETRWTPNLGAGDAEDDTSPGATTHPWQQHRLTPVGQQALSCNSHGAGTEQPLKETFPCRQRSSSAKPKLLHNCNSHQKKKKKSHQQKPPDC